LTVTQHHIDEAIPRDSGHCMIAESVRDAFPGAARVSVDIQTIRFTDRAKGLRYIYLTPRSAQQALVNWDDGIKPEPWTMRLRGGMVVRAGSNSTRPQSPSQRASALEGLSKARLVVRNGSGNVPDRVGGPTPPTSGYGRIRAFGLRGLVR
jgi:hypothetical protein